MDEIIYTLRPDWLTAADLKKCMERAHESNRKKGIVMQNQFMTESEFEEYYKDKICFVAMKGSEVIGTMSYKITTCKHWWARGQKVVYNCADAIIPEYQGSDVYLKLRELREEHIMNSGVRIIQSDTAENNKMIRKICRLKGGKEVKIYTSPKTWYYSVVMVRWLDGCPYSDRFCCFMFNLSSIIIKVLWRPGHKFRFWFK